MHIQITSPQWIEEDRGYKTKCWIWQGATNNSGYGQLWSSDFGIHTLAHRVLFWMFRGPIPEGLEIDHLCAVRTCVNPSHMEPVAEAVNVRRGRTTHLTDEDIAEIRSSDLTQTELAKIYGVHQSNISRIQTHDTWKEVKPIEPATSER